METRQDARWHIFARGLLAITIGAIIAVAVDRTLWLGLARVRRGEFGQWSDIVHGRAHTDILVLGSSRAFAQYDCDTLADLTGKSCLNAGLAGARSNYILALGKTFLAHNDPPSVLLLNADESAVVHADWNFWHFVPYYTEPAWYSAVSSANPDIWWDRYIPLFAFGHFGRELTTAAVLGLLGQDVPNSTRTQRGHLLKDFDWDGNIDDVPSKKTLLITAEGVRSFEELATLFASRGTRVVLVYAPVYYPVQLREPNRGELIAYFQRFASERGMLFLDHSVSPLSQDKTMFSDGEHVNARGARVFARELAEALMTHESIANRGPRR